MASSASIRFHVDAFARSTSAQYGDGDRLAEPLIQVFSFWIPLAWRRSARVGLVAAKVAATTPNVSQVVNLKGKK
jgi:hypothetical protein